MDHFPKKRRIVHPINKANIVSQIFFIYILPLFKKGFKYDLQEKDLYEVPSTLRSKKLGDKMQHAWNRQKSSGRTSVFQLLWISYGKTYLLMGFAQLAVGSVVILVQPYALGKFVSYFSPNQREITSKEAFYYAAAVIALNSFEAVFNNNYFLLITEIGIKARTALCSLIYRKALRISSDLGGTSSGKIVTLITKDAQTIETVLTYINAFWIGSVNSAVALFVLYNKIGKVAFLPFFILLLSTPVQVLFGTWATKLRKKICEKTDLRLQTTKETFSAIKIVKMYCWESWLTSKISEARRTEVRLTFQMSALRFTILVVTAIFRNASFYSMFLTYMWLGNPLNANIFYFMLRCYQHLAYNLCDLFPSGVTHFGEFYASMRRIEQVLNSDEIVPRKVTKSNSPEVSLKNVTIQLQSRKIFDNVNLIITGGLTLITGSIGSGKSVLIKSIAGDYEPAEGEIEVKGTISYAGQEPWLFPSTIRQNILFGQPFNEMRYREVVDVCALRYDLNLLHEGDDTIVEDRGSNLSKGQQARINLARAVYRNCDIYLLDDCLAALDNKISNYVFKECISKFLKKKLVILVAYSHLEEADKIVVVENGELRSLTTYQELEKNEIDNEPNNETKAICKDIAIVEEEQNEAAKLLNHPLSNRRVHQDINKSGQVSYTAYWNYVKLGGGYLIGSGVILVFVLAQVGDSLLDKLCSQWADFEEASVNHTVGNVTIYIEGYEEKRNSLFTINLTCAISVLTLFLVRAAVLFLFTRNVSLNIHKHMITALAKARMAFFDSNFTGNILNRFSKDLNTIDEVIPFVLFNLITAFLLLIGIVVLIATVNVIFLIPTLFFFFTLILIRWCYLPTGRSLKRLDASTRSPLVGYLNATLEGLTTARASQIEKTLIMEFDRHQDLYTSASYTLQTSMSGFIFWLDNICTLFISLIMSRFLVFSKGSISGEVGLAVSQAFMMTEKLRSGIRQWADIENQMTSFERALEYTEIKQEPRSGLIVDNWPKKGKITYENVSLIYADSRETILKNLNFEAKSQEKIGIIGRTGAGKSSLLSTLFRLYEVKGRILIDGIDIKMMSLELLRSHISIIPQDPILFTGTIRDNIDLEGRYKDEEVWRAIESAQLSSTITTLNFEIKGCGNQFSAGQRQLICIARAIIRKNKIVVLDEATANIDPKTEKLVLKTIQSNFSSCTMLIIAHRLQSVMNCDKVMVLEKGEIKEFGPPAELMKLKDGRFYNMVQASNLSSW